MAKKERPLLSDSDIYAGLAGIELDFDEMEISDGIVLRRTFAHLMAPFMMAFAPTEPGRPHPAPWKAAEGGFGFDITAELVIPKSDNGTIDERIDTAKTIVAVMRLWASPTLIMPVISNISFSKAAKAADNETRFIPLEILPHQFRLESPEGRILTKERLAWVAIGWRSAMILQTNHAEVRLAISALDKGQFVNDTSLTLVSLWSALEALFSPDKAQELRFRVSALIASYLEPPGESRLMLQKKVAKLYDERSLRVHGKHKEDPDNLLQTFELLRRIIIKMITEHEVPSRESLEQRLFGASTST